MNTFQTQIVLDALDEPGKLTPWEIEFIDSMAERDDDYEASEKQNSVLNRIRHNLDYGEKDITF